MSIEEKVALPKPVACTIDLTEACNLACDYCFTFSDHKKRDLTEKLGRSIIDWWLPQTDQNSKIDIAWWGGEPLLKWNLLKKLTYYSKKLANELGREVKFGGTTNGVLYTPDKVEWCLEHKSLFLVSLDGIQPAHDFHRKTVNGQGSWKIVDKNLREALKLAPWQRIRVSFSAYTIKYFLESVQYFVEDLGIKNFAFSPVFESDWNDEAFEICEEQFNLAVDYAVKRAKQNDPIVMKHINDEANMNNKRHSIQNPCGAGGGYTGWSVDGFMFPCHRFNKHGLSTKERYNLSTIIAKPIGDSFEYCNDEWRKAFYTWKDAPPLKCVNCSIYRKSVCNGGCYAVNFDCTGDIYIPSEKLCKYNKIQHDVGIRYKKIADQENIDILQSGWGENLGKKDNKCLCYNMCYLENTDEEIIYLDSQSGKSCLCYQTNYTGLIEPQFRTRLQLEGQKKLEKKFFDLSRRIILTSNVSKDEQQIELEAKVLKKTAEILESK